MGRKPTGVDADPDGHDRRWRCLGGACSVRPRRGCKNSRSDRPPLAMAVVSLLALLDDITRVPDDVALMSVVNGWRGQKTSH